MDCSYVLASFFTHSFTSMPQGFKRKSIWYIIWKQHFFFSVFHKVCIDMQPDLWTLIKCCTFLLWLPGVAGQWLPGIWELWQQNSKWGAYWLQESVLPLNGYLSAWCALQELHHWIHPRQRQVGSTKSRCELTENIALKNTSIFRKTVVFMIFLTKLLSCVLKISFY